MSDTGAGGGGGNNTGGGAEGGSGHDDSGDDGGGGWWWHLWGDMRRWLGSEKYEVTTERAVAGVRG